MMIKLDQIMWGVDNEEQSLLNCNSESYLKIIITMIER